MGHHFYFNMYQNIFHIIKKYLALLVFSNSTESVGFVKLFGGYLYMNQNYTILCDYDEQTNLHVVIFLFIHILIIFYFNMQTTVSFVRYKYDKEAHAQFYSGSTLFDIFKILPSNSKLRITHTFMY
jgi:hypothetical protein